MAKDTNPNQKVKLSDLLSEDAIGLLTASGKNLIKRIGIDVIRGVVLDVLTGRNIRNSTEILTRRRIAALNLATVQLFMQDRKSSIILLTGFHISHLIF